MCSTAVWRRSSLQGHVKCNLKHPQTKQVRLVQDKCRSCPSRLCPTLVKSYPNLFNGQTKQLLFLQVVSPIASTALWASPPSDPTMEYSIRAASVEDCKDIRRLIGVSAGGRVRTWKAQSRVGTVWELKTCVHRSWLNMRKLQTRSQSPREVSWELEHVNPFFPEFNNQEKKKKPAAFHI